MEKEEIEEYANQFQKKVVVTDEDIEEWAAGRVNEIDPDEYGYGDLLIEGAKWMRDKLSK
jgi:hypothetical protein